MASNFKQANDKVIVGDDAPIDGDPLCTNLSAFPVKTIYINENTGTIYARNTVNGNAADWVSQSSTPVTTPGIDDVLAAGNDAGGAIIKNLGDPVDDQDAGTKKYVDDNNGIDSVLGKSQPFTSNHSVDQAGFNMSFQNGVIDCGDLQINTDNEGKIRLNSPNGNTWILTVSDAGALVITAD